MDETVVRRQLDAVAATRAALEPTAADEGFAEVVVLREPAEVDLVRVVRHPPA